MKKSGLIKTREFMLSGDNIKLVVTTKAPTFDAVLSVSGVSYIDCFNDDEPYDRKTHVFFFPKKSVTSASVLTLSLKLFRRLPFKSEFSFEFGSPEFHDEEKLKKAYDNELKVFQTESEELTPGVTYTHTLYKDKEDKPVHTFVTRFEKGSARLYVGTPSDSYESVKVRATIPDMVKAAQKNGHNILAAVNADFFDIFGDFHPAGLCVKNGVTVANPESKRNFAALLSDGSHVITNLQESPSVISEIVHAASGLQLIVRDGEISDYAPLEPFSFTRHPRTAVGVTKDESVVLLVVDGRIPDYSNGATLVDLAKIMISLGCDRAVNFDGGGSSAMYTVRNGEPVLHSRPADLFRPTAKLIRKDFNSFLVETE